MSTVRPRTVSGMRPTGPLHLGHYFGVLKNWVELQHTEEAYFFVADWHALTSDYADPSNIATNVEEMVKDWVAAGLDPEKCVIFRQSAVKEHAELSLLLSMITPVSWLERNPTYKEQQQQITNKDLGNAGFLCYPVLMAADILMYRPHGVPVGEDQLPHMELTREIARRFNYLYGGNFFLEPQAMLTPAAKCPAWTAARCPRVTTTASSCATPWPTSSPRCAACSPTRPACARAIPATRTSATSSPTMCCWPAPKSRPRSAPAVPAPASAVWNARSAS